MTKRLNNQSTVGDVLKQIIQVNKLQPGMDQIDVKEASFLNIYLIHSRLKFIHLNDLL
jgi:hypothetical protein